MNWTEEELADRDRKVLGIGVPTVLSLDVPLAADLMPEWMIEAEVTKLLEADGWRALRTDPVSDRGRGKGFGEVGMADHMYIRYENPGFSDNGKFPLAHVVSQVLWIEFKAAKGKPQKHQLDWHNKERARGALTLIAGVDFPASVEGFKAWYRASGLNRGGINV